MKRLFVFQFLVLLLWPTSSVYALAVNLIESSYSYDIHSVIRWPDSEKSDERLIGHSGQEEIQKDVTLAKLSDEVTGYFGGNVTASPFFLRANSAGWAWSDAGDIELIGGGHAFVSGTWTFSPIETNIGLSFIHQRPGAWDANYIILNDLTSGIELFNGSSMVFLEDFGWIENNLGFIWEGQTINTIPYDWDGVINEVFYSDHNYQLTIGLIAQSGGDHWSSRIAADLTVADVPEPSTIVMLISFICVIAFARTELLRYCSSIIRMS